MFSTNEWEFISSRLLVPGDIFFAFNSSLRPLLLIAKFQYNVDDEMIVDTFLVLENGVVWKFNRTQDVLFIVPGWLGRKRLVIANGGDKRR